MTKKIILGVLAVIIIFAGFWVSQTAVKAVRVKNLLHKISALRGGETEDNPGLATLEITDQEINDGLALLCVAGQVIKINQKIGLIGGEKPALNAEKTFLPCQFFKDFRIRFEDGGYSAEAQFLKPVAGKVSLEGKIFLADKRDIRLEFSTTRLDNQTASPETAALLENTANQELNKILGQTSSIAIESIEIKNGKIIIRGIFPIDEILCSLDADRFCSQ